MLQLIFGKKGPWSFLYQLLGMARSFLLSASLLSLGGRVIISPKALRLVDHWPSDLFWPATRFLGSPPESSSAPLGDTSTEALLQYLKWERGSWVPFGFILLPFAQLHPVESWGLSFSSGSAENRILQATPGQEKVLTCVPNWMLFKCSICANRPP